VKILAAILVAASVSLLNETNAAEIEFDHQHEAFTKVLSARVVDGMVDYDALGRSPRPLHDYLDSIASVQQSEFDTWSNEQQLALLMNLYNAATLKLIIDNQPIDSIKDIGTFFKGPWKQRVVGLFGDTITLND